MYEIILIYLTGSVYLVYSLTNIYWKHLLEYVIMVMSTSNLTQVQSQRFRHDLIWHKKIKLHPIAFYNINLRDLRHFSAEMILETLKLTNANDLTP